jgi:hypothetical protein
VIAAIPSLSLIQRAIAGQVSCLPLPPSPLLSLLQPSILVHTVPSTLRTF